MLGGLEKSPCAGCPIHLRKLDKLDERLPCGACSERIAYADRNYGMPARQTDEDVYWLHGDSVEFFYLFKDGLKIID